MIGCDNSDCPIEWFHFGCMGLTSKPKGKWYCPKCAPSFKKKKWHSSFSNFTKVKQHRDQYKALNEIKWGRKYEERTIGPIVCHAECENDELQLHSSTCHFSRALLPRPKVHQLLRITIAKLAPETIVTQQEICRFLSTLAMLCKLSVLKVNYKIQNSQSLFAMKLWLFSSIQCCGPLSQVTRHQLAMQLLTSSLSTDTWMKTNWICIIS